MIGLQTTPIGLDVGGRWIKAVQLRRVGPRVRVIAAARFQRSGSETPSLTAAEAKRTAEILRRNGFVGSSVVVPLPACQQFSCAVRLPPRDSGAPLDQIALSQLADHSRLAPEQLVASWWEAPTGGTPRETAGFALGGKRKDVEAILDAYRDSGLDCIAVDARPCALVRACAGLLESGEFSAGSMTATVDIGSASGTLCVVHRGRLVYERTLPEFGTSALRKRLEKELRVDADVADFLLTSVGLGAAGSPGAPADGVTGGTSRAAGVADEVGRGAAGSGEESSEVIAEAQEIIGQQVALMAEELQTSLQYAAGTTGGQPAGQVLLVGGGALTRGLPQRLAGCMGGASSEGGAAGTSATATAEQTRIRTLGLADLFEIAPHIDPSGSGGSLTCSMIVAAGLALNDSRVPAIEVGVEEGSMGGGVAA